jgi:hypothetical protein
MERLAKSHAERTNVRGETAQISQAIAAPAFVDNRPRVATLRKWADSMNNSPRVAAQRKLAETLHDGPRMAALRNLTETLHNSPRVTAQRKLMDRMLAGPVQLEGVTEEEQLLQGQFESAQRTAAEVDSTPRANNTGLPDHLRSGIESLSGISLDDVKVHYNSARPAQLNALAYAQGSEIHVAPGQERHLPHEAWHVVQQAQGRVRPTLQLKDGVPVNDEEELEREADVMGARAAPEAGRVRLQDVRPNVNADVMDARSSVAQRVTEEEIPDLKKSLYADIFTYLTTQTTGSDALKDELTLKSRDRTVAWLRPQNDFSSISIVDAVARGMQHFEEALAPVLLVGLKRAIVPLHEEILSYLTMHAPGPNEDLRNQIALVARNKIVSWLGHQNIGSLSTEETVALGMKEFINNFDTEVSDALVFNARLNAENWVIENAKLERGQFQLDYVPFTIGNCHGLTFAHDPQMVLNPDLPSLLAIWKKKSPPEIAVFLSGGELAHSARKTQHGYLNTLPDGPAFYCEPAVLARAMGYAPFHLLPRDFETLQKYAADTEDKERHQAKLDEADKILGYGKTHELDGAEALFWTLQNLEGEKAAEFVEQHSKEIATIRNILVTKYKVTF